LFYYIKIIIQTKTKTKTKKRNGKYLRVTINWRFYCCLLKNAKTFTGKNHPIKRKVIIKRGKSPRKNGQSITEQRYPTCKEHFQSSIYGKRKSTSSQRSQQIGG